MADEPEVGQGDSGEWVTYLQSLLTHYGHPTEADGTFGPQTEAGVRAAQAAAGVPETGRTDAATWAALMGTAGGAGGTGGGGEYKVSFFERPVVRDGAVVWSMRNDGPSANTGQRDLYTLIEVESGNDLSMTENVWDTGIGPEATAPLALAVIDLFQGTPPHDDALYRLDIRLHVGGHGDEASVEFMLRYGVAVPA